MTEHYCDCCGHTHGDLEAYEKIAQLKAKNAKLKRVRDLAMKLPKGGGTRGVKRVVDGLLDRIWYALADHEITEDYILHGNPTPQEVLDFYNLHTGEGAANFSNADAGLSVLLWHALACVLKESE